MLGHIDHGAAEFTAQRQALDHAHQHKGDRGKNSGRCIGRQHPDHERRTAHQDDRDQKSVFASDQVSQAAKDDGAERPQHEARGEAKQRKDEAGRRVDAGEKHARDLGCKQTDQEEVVKLEYRAQGCGDDDAPVLF
ncbi:hypothetical protein D3C86_1208670 [compost metagenome]